MKIKTNVKAGATNGTIHIGGVAHLLTVSNRTPVSILVGELDTGRQVAPAAVPVELPA